METTDRQAIAALADRLYAAWNAGDAAQYARLFTPEAEYIAFDGAVQQGRAAIEAGHKPLFECWLKGSRLQGQVVAIRPLGADAALVQMRGTMLLKGQRKASADRASIQTLVALRCDGEWLFTSFHNTRLRPITASFGSVIAWKIADLTWKLLGKRSPLPVSA